jgi:hypothetical protein
MPEPIVMKFGMYVMLPEAISTAYFINHLPSVIAASQVIEVITLILLIFECLSPLS